MKTDITVLIPTFNRGAFLIPSLASVIRQTLEPEQVIVIDDGSTDDAREVLAQWVAGRPDRGDRILYLRQESRGKSAALNYGLQFVETEWIGFNDSDDFWLPTKLGDQFSLLGE